MGLIAATCDYPQLSDADRAYSNRQAAELNTGSATALLEQVVALAGQIPDDADYDAVAPRLRLLEALWLGWVAFARLAELDPLAALAAVEGAEDTAAGDIGHEAQLRLNGIDLSDA